MNSSSRMIRTAVLLTLSLVITSVTFAEPQSKRRAVNPGSGVSGATPGQPTALLTGTILDSTTNAPVVGVLVQVSSRSGRSDAHGNFLIKMVPGVSNALIFSRTGYDAFSTNVTISADAAQTFRLIPRATVKLKMTSGVTSELDSETVEFGYVAPFVGYNKDTTLNLCKSGGDSFKPDRSEIKHITPGLPLTDTKCCPNGPIPTINVELKSGGTTNAGFADSCFGDKVDVIAIDHLTAGPVYIHFSDIADLTFP